MAAKKQSEGNKTILTRGSIGSVRGETMPNGQPINTYLLRGRDVLPITQERDCGYVEASREGSLDKPRLGPTSDEGIRICGPPVLDGGSKKPNYTSQGLRQVGELNIGSCLSQSSHTTQHDEQESGPPMVQMTTKPATAGTPIRDRAVDVARGALDHVLPVSPDSQNGDGSRTTCTPVTPQLQTHTLAPPQDLNATLTKFRTFAQQVYEHVQAPLSTLENRATDLEQKIYRTRNETMRLELCPAIDVENIIGALASIETNSTVKQRLIAEFSTAAQRRAEEEVRLHAMVKGLEENLKALQNIVSPC
ncbi:hypothetical protein V496_02279 [Pseudogymnoascus sp. VKM F-4515 (FW-2607)]|nr:hypothetical protein V496_02279 [Pseudogymnoascus sp. VKM F-4515 (FW-2607)]